MSNDIVTYRQGADTPDTTLTWKDDAGTLINFATGYTFSLKLAKPGATAAAFTKTTGITGAATAPNVTIVWATSGELNTLPAGRYLALITALRTSDNRQRIEDFTIVVKPTFT